MWKEVKILSTNFSAKHTPSATLIEIARTRMYSDWKTLVPECTRIESWDSK